MSHVKYPSEENKNPKRKRLGCWICHQRQLHKNDMLLPKQIRLLEQIPGWYWNSHRHRWNVAYNKLVAFFSDNKKFPNRQDNPSLVTWVSTQQKAFKEGELSQENRHKLEQIPGWHWKFRLSDKEKLEKLAHDGGNRPKFNTTLGKVLVRFTQTKTSDPEWNKKIRKLRPNWFHNIKGRPPDKRKRKQLQKLIERGMSVTRVSEQLNCSLASVYALMKRAGISLSPRNL